MRVGRGLVGQVSAQVISQGHCTLPLFWTDYWLSSCHSPSKIIWFPYLTSCFTLVLTPCKWNWVLPKNQVPLQSLWITYLKCSLSCPPVSLKVVEYQRKRDWDSRPLQNTTVYKTLSSVPDSLFVERLELPGPCSKEQIQTVPNEGHEGMQKQRKSSHRIIVQGLPWWASG